MDGARGRLLDPRRTPVLVRELDLRCGMVELEVTAFEDAGARWSVPLEEAARFQFARGQAQATGAAVMAMTAAVRRHDRPVVVDGGPRAAARTAARLTQERAAVRSTLDEHGVRGRSTLDAAAHAAGALDPRSAIARRAPDPVAAAAAHAVLAARGLAELDAAFAAAYTSNPWAGELLKGHAIVLGALGVVPYRGKVVRDDRLFDAPWTRERRAEHLLVRLALTQELWARTGASELRLYRAGPPGASRIGVSGSLVSATFARAVADAHVEPADAPRARPTMVRELRVPLTRGLMTFWETPALSRVYAEAEAILLAYDFPT